LPAVDMVVSEMKRVCKPDGAICLTTDYSDVPPESGKSGSTFDRAALEGLITKFGLPHVGDVDYDNVDLADPANRAVRGEYTFASLVMENLKS
jgi:hypothetical protein